MAQAADSPKELEIESNIKFTVSENVPSDLMKLTEKLSAEAIADHGCFRIAVSGGSFPKNFAAGISGDSKVDFSKWRVFFADERCVPLDSDQSNFKGFKEQFMGKAKMEDSQVFAIDQSCLDSVDETKDDDDSMKSAAKMMSEQYLKDILKEFGVDPQDKQTIPSFDCVYLGMGPDGHTASLFPGHKLLDSENLVDFITDSPKQPPHRITLTLPLICDAHHIVFVVTGESKQDAMKNITACHNDEKALQTLPSGLVTERACGTVTWLLDKAASASSKL